MCQLCSASLVPAGSSLSPSPGLNGRARLVEWPAFLVLAVRWRDDAKAGPHGFDIRAPRGVPEGKAPGQFDTLVLVASTHASVRRGEGAHPGVDDVRLGPTLAANRDHRADQGAGERVRHGPEQRAQDLVAGFVVRPAAVLVRVRLEQVHSHERGRQGPDKRLDPAAVVPAHQQAPACRPAPGHALEIGQQPARAKELDHEGDRVGGEADIGSERDGRRSPSVEGVAVRLPQRGRVEGTCAAETHRARSPARSTATGAPRRQGSRGIRRRQPGEARQGAGSRPDRGRRRGVFQSQRGRVPPRAGRQRSPLPPPRRPGEDPRDRVRTGGAGAAAKGVRGGGTVRGRFPSSAHRARPPEPGNQAACAPSRRPLWRSAATAPEGTASTSTRRNSTASLLRTGAGGAVRPIMVRLFKVRPPLGVRRNCSVGFRQRRCEEGRRARAGCVAQSGPGETGSGSPSPATPGAGPG